MSLRAFRAEGSPGSGLPVELYTSADGPVILYGHDGMTPEQEQRLEHWMRMNPPLRVGDVLHGYCPRTFSGGGTEIKRVEAIGADWVVVRGETERYRDDDEPDFYHGDPERLTQYREPEPP